MIRKKKLCIDCNVVTFIFSAGRCKTCSQIHKRKIDSKALSDGSKGVKFLKKVRSPLRKKSGLKRITKVGQERRKEKRKGYGEFFTKHVDIIRTKYIKCMECDSHLFGGVENVAHILPKSRYDEVSTVDDNILYLCSYRDMNTCHSDFDGSNKQLQSMNIYESAREKVIELTKKYNITLNIKDIERWGL